MSPELALVDAALANELRATLEVRAAAPVAVAPVAVAVAPVAAASTSPIDEDDPIADLIVLEPDTHVAEAETHVTEPESHLPEPSDDPIVEEVAATLVAAPTFQIDEDDPVADLIVLEPETHVAEAESHVTEPESHVPEPSVDPIVEETDHQAESWYPVLPAPATDDAEPLDATETALREIRERLTTPAPARRRRRFRRRFTVASGLITVIAVGVFAADVSYGVTQLPV